jgi:hypothetical protein
MIDNLLIKPYKKRDSLNKWEVHLVLIKLNCNKYLPPLPLNSLANLLKYKGV